MPPPALRWFACSVRSRHEFAVRDAFIGARIEQFLPTWEETTRWSDRIAKVTRPLFPGYIFIRCVPTDALQVLQMRGVCAVLGMPTIAQAFKPEPIEDAVLANLQRLAATPAAFSPAPYVCGESVTLARGPFAGVTGIVSRVKDGATLTIPVEILGRAVSVQIDAADVEVTIKAKAATLEIPKT